jgi:hypothetical protein
MQIVLSKSIPSNEAEIVNNIVSAIFEAQKVAISSFNKDSTLVISNNHQEKADFHVNVPSFLGYNTSHKMIVLKNLAHVIFGEYVDPRVIISLYNKLSSQPKPVTATNADNHKNPEAKPVNNTTVSSQQAVKPDTLPASGQDIAS